MLKISCFDHMKHFLFTLLFFLPVCAYAHEYRMHNVPTQLENKQEIVSDKVSSIILSSNLQIAAQDEYLQAGQLYTHEKFLNQIIKPLKHIQFKFWLYPNGNTTSFSNAMPDCEINYSNPLHKSFLLSEQKKDVFFSLTHEIGHCILGKDALLNMDWVINLTQEQQTQLNNYIAQQTHQAFKNKNLDKLPLVAYHETFADMFSILWLYHQHILSLNDIAQIAKKRHDEAQIDSPYVSYLAIDNFLSFIQKGNLKSENITEQNIKNLAILFSQQAFVAYLLAL